MNKKIILLVLVLIFSLASCSLFSNKTENMEDDVLLNDDNQEIDLTLSDDTSILNDTDDTSILNDTAMEEQVDDLVIKQSITPLDVYNIYMEKFPNTKVYKIELDKENNKFVYEIEGFDNEKKYELKIDPSTGNIVKEETKASSEKRSELSKESIEKIQRFIDKALTQIDEDAVLKEWELRMRNNIPVIEIEVDMKGRKGIEYLYNIETEELLRVDD